MSWPLREEDPRQLGAYRLRGRLRVHPAGVVYLGRDSEDRSVSVAALDAGAVSDAAARERFVAAVRGAGRDRGGPRVLASRTAGRSVLWVASPYGEASADAGVFLESVVAEESAAAGPRYRPYWSGDSGARAGWRWASGGGPRAAVAGGAFNRAVVVGLVVLMVLFMVLVVLVYVLLVGVRERVESRVPVVSPSPTSTSVPSSPGGEEGVSESPTPGDRESVPRVPLRERDSSATPRDPGGLA